MDKIKFDDYLGAKEFLEKKQQEHSEKHAKDSDVKFDTNSNIAVIMQEYAEEYHRKKGKELPGEITKEDLEKGGYKHGLTVGKLKEYLYKTELPADARVLIQRVEDVYYQNHGWDVFFKEGDDNHNFIKMNENMREEIARRERGEEPQYPQMEDPSKFIVPETEEVLNSLKDQYHPAWCVFRYNDEEHLFIDLHY